MVVPPHVWLSNHMLVNSLEASLVAPCPQQCTESENYNALLLDVLFDKMASMGLSTLHNSSLWSTLFSVSWYMWFPSAVGSYHIADERVQDVVNGREVQFHRRLDAKLDLCGWPITRASSTLPQFAQPLISFGLHACFVNRSKR